MLDKHLIAEVRPAADKSCIVGGEGYRISVLTPELLRVETGEFTDEATQSVWFRDFERPKFAVSDKGGFLFIETVSARYTFSKSKKKVTEITFIKDGRTVKCSNSRNLKGTRRTLDFTVGRARLGNGLMSRKGVSVFDDSGSLLLLKGQPLPRFGAGRDLYIFAYGANYRKCLRDFFELTGAAPLIPRFALGNWWSRYRAYSQGEYTDLMRRFKEEGIPITVATIDMDWHWVDVGAEFGLKFNKLEKLRAGWTGYSWNTRLFPDYKGFLKYLHADNMKTTLNLHPADGVRWFEDMYPEMAEAAGINPASRRPVEFDITDRNFINSYFKILHNPYEEDGVDFWWIDWQQGKNTAIKGLDPLWALNHYHYLNSQRRNKRPLILSRYAGVGSHRYPLGFSGDTHIHWSTLRFLPYFTATAANIGYTWWSHDIGGHMLGMKSNEMYLRWLQFGVFSPVNRLHSTSHDLQGKEPWNYSDATEHYAKQALRLRHRLIPYIYSMNYRTHKQGIALCEPMYYTEDTAEAYKYNNQYYFGSELIAAPVVTKQKRAVAMAKTRVWLPKGRWTDIFTGRIYTGGKRIDMFRGISGIPVLAKEGAIIPLSDEKGNRWQNPAALTIYIYRGSGAFTLYEDDGETMAYKDGKFALTEMTVAEADGKLTFTISAAAGAAALIPAERRYLLVFKDIEAEKALIETDGLQSEADTIKKNGESAVSLTLKPSQKAAVTFTDYRKKSNADKLADANRILSQAQGVSFLKMLAYIRLKRVKDEAEYLKRVKRSPLLKRCVKQAIYEIFA